MNKLEPGFLGLSILSDSKLSLQLLNGENTIKLKGSGFSNTLGFDVWRISRMQRNARLTEQIAVNVTSLRKTMFNT